MFVSKLQQSAMVAGKPCWMICLKHGCSDKTLFFKGSGSNLATPYSFSKAAALDGLHRWKRGQFYWLRDGKPCSAFKGTGLASYSEAWQGWSCDTSGHKAGDEEVGRKFQAVAKVHVKGYYVIEMVYVPEPWIKMLPTEFRCFILSSTATLLHLPTPGGCRSQDSRVGGSALSLYWTCFFKKTAIYELKTAEQHAWRVPGRSRGMIFPEWLPGVKCLLMFVAWRKRKRTLQGKSPIWADGGQIGIWASYGVPV